MVTGELRRKEKVHWECAKVCTPSFGTLTLEARGEPQLMTMVTVLAAIPNPSSNKVS